ncbi:MAG: hypothetical protein NO475_03715 [Candidatus Methanomethylicia archaeon]|nr:hypothetical protein [Candidatus Methanomethylicia archaeon]
MIIDEMLKRLRYVKRYPDPESEIRHDDINAKIDTLKAIRDVLKEKIGEDPLVDELDAILNLIPYVKVGDTVEPEHHNLIVDALKKVRDLLAKIEEYYAEKYEELKRISESLMEIVGGFRITYFETPAPLPLTFYNSVVIDFVDNVYESTWSISEEVSKVKVDYDSGNIAINISDQVTT